MLTEVQAHEAIPSHVNLLRFEQAWEEKGYLYIQVKSERTSTGIKLTLDRVVPSFASAVHG